MAISYDKYYQTENLFGNPYPVLIDFFAAQGEKGKVLDLGCGQGRDAIPIARLGFEVKGIDVSKVGIGQMNEIAEKEGLALSGVVADVFEFDDFAEYDFVLLNSMFHFAKNDWEKEVAFIQRILSNTKEGCCIIFCIQETGKKVEILNKTIPIEKQFERLVDKKFQYIFEDQKTNHQSKSDYRIIVLKKIKK